MDRSGNEGASELTSPRRLWTRAEVLAGPSPVPADPGVYAWYFDETPGDFDVHDCLRCDGKALLYVGIAPARPIANDGSPAKSNLRVRLRMHYAGNADASTLRLALGALLRERLGISPGRSAGGRLTFGSDGEQRLSDWMAQHAFVTWKTHPEPWLLEHDLIESLDLPLNLKGNRRHANWQPLTAARAALRAASWQQP